MTRRRRSRCWLARRLSTAAFLNWLRWLSDSLLKADAVAAAQVQCYSSMEDMRDLITTLRDLERELHESSVRTSGRVAELLADSFVEFGCSGRAYSKAEVISTLLAEPATTISATDFKLHQISPEVALLTYRACRHSVQDVYSLRSSIWQLQAGQWQILFHQGTPCAAPAHSGL